MPPAAVSTVKVLLKPGVVMKFIGVTTTLPASCAVPETASRSALPAPALPVQSARTFNMPLLVWT